MRDLTGQQLGEYTIKKLIGQGATGTVYLAQHAKFDVEWAVKVIHDHLADNEEFRKRFLKEAEAMKSLRSDNIVRVVDAAGTEDLAYFVMEYVPHGSLAEFIASYPAGKSELPLPLVIDLARQAAKGLSDAHAMGIMHRDIKPANLLLWKLGDNYIVKLVDFGLARSFDDDQRTSDGAPRGTPAYMSPEQCSGAKVDARTDIYSLGIVFYEMATGQLPFDTENMAKAVHSHVYAQPMLPRFKRPEIPENMEQVILRCLEKNPERRFATAEEMAEALDKLKSLGPAVINSGIKMAVPLDDPEREGSVRASSQQPDTPPPPPPALPQQSQHRSLYSVLVLDQSGAIRGEYPLTGPAQISIGQSGGITLPSTDIPAQHTILHWDENDKAVIEYLGGGNKTWINGNYVINQVDKQEWRNESWIYIRPFWLWLSPPAAAPISRKIGVIVLPESQRIEIEPGKTRACRFNVVNLGERVAYFSVSPQLRTAGGVEVAKGWVQNEVNLSEQLYPNETTSDPVSLGISVPREPGNEAGEYVLSLPVRSEAYPSETGKATARLIVLPYHDVVAQTNPGRASAYKRASFDVTFGNNGNTPISGQAQAHCDDQEVELIFNAGQPFHKTGVISASGKSQTTLRAKLPLIWFGSRRASKINLNFKPDQGLSPVEIEIPLTRKPLLGPIEAAALVLAAIAFVFLMRIYAKPFINQPYAENIKRGQPVTIVWEASRASKIIIQDTAGGAPVILPKDATKYVARVVNGNKTYKIWAENFWGKSDERLVLISLEDPIVTISASKNAINTGESVEISWVVENAEGLQVKNDFGGAGGKFFDSPVADKTYKVWVNDKSGKEFKDEVRVAVIPIGPTPTPPPPNAPIIAFTYDAMKGRTGGRPKSNLRKGDKIVLNWSATNAQSVRLDGDISEFNLPFTGNKEEVCVDKETNNYKLIVVGIDGKEYIQNLQVKASSDGCKVVGIFGNKCKC